VHSMSRRPDGRVANALFNVVVVSISLPRHMGCFSKRCNGPSLPGKRPR
jgi:hypothetical protein